MTLLRQRAAFAPDACAYVFLADRECQEQRLSYGELDTQARNIAARLQALDVTGERALLLYPPGLDYIAAFFGCLYAGVVAVPAYPPSRHHLHRLKAIVQDAAPAMVITTAEWREKVLDSYEESWGRTGLEWLTTDTPVGDGTAPWVPPAVGPDSLAFLQYTSGSTGNPKGVMVSHGNLMANQRAIQQAFGHTEETIVVGWLPLYHDMGLIGNILQPLYLGSTAILMSPLAFLEQPARWLKAISKYRAATSGGPNFAYELCARKVTSEQKRELDLSGWTLAFNGSEPVRASTMGRFADAFAPCGFRRQAFFPCYGLAEATLFVTGRRLATGQNVGCAVRTEQAAAHDHRPLVSCGHTWTGHEARIVDPKTGIPCPDGQDGEIWVAGPGVALGYWNRQEGSEETFRATLSSPRDTLSSKREGGGGAGQIDPDRAENTFLRTGDLGFIDQGDLYITGRIKDLIILRGRNYYPQDLEQALEEGVAALRPGCSAAFSVDEDGEEALIVVAEIRREALRNDAQAVLAVMRQALAEICDGPVGALVLVPPGAVPKTSSGKIRRQACQEAYLAGQLKILARSGEAETQSPAPTSTTGSEALDLLREALRALPPTGRTPLITRFLLSELAKALRVPEASLVADSRIHSLGLDSLKATEVKHAVDRLLGVEAPLSEFLSDRMVAGLAEILAEAASATSAESVPAAGERSDSAVAEEQDAVDLSRAQQAIWSVHQLEPRSIAYNLHLALRIHGDMDPQVLHCAFDALLERHVPLRTRYAAKDASVEQRVVPPAEWPEYFQAVDALGWSESRLQTDLTRRVREPFDLARGPMLRVTCYTLGESSYVLLLCAHHIAVDLRACLILLTELKSIVQDMTRGQPPRLAPPAVGYRDFMGWQQRYLQSSVSRKADDFWHSRLAGELPILALPTDRPRPPVPTYGGSSHPLRLDRVLTEKLKRVGQEHGATLFMTLLSAYTALLHRYTRQQDIIVGTAHNGRPQALFADVVGSFVNPIALRCHPSPELSFCTYLEQVRDTVVDALPYADYPFSVLVERLKPERSGENWPIYQTWFGLQQVPLRTSSDEEGTEGCHSSRSEQASAHVVLGEEGDVLKWGDWILAPQTIRERVENFDLRLMAAEDESGLLLSFCYRTDLFQSQTIARLAGHFNALIEGMVSRPESRLSELPLLTDAEYGRQVIAWNATSSAYPWNKCLHQLFELQVENTPAAVAAVYGAEQLTYAELDARANQLAHHLRGKGVERETAVGLYVERSLEMAIGILGILKAGGAYVPIDPSYPRERIADLLASSKASVLLTQENLVPRLPPHGATLVCLDRDHGIIALESQTYIPNSTRPTNLAYIIFTSGSTGEPKGVAVTHKNAVHSTWARMIYYPEPMGAFLLLSSFAFDSSVAGIFWTLSQGGCICLPTEGNEREPRVLGELITNTKITHLLCLPSLYGLLLESVPRSQLESLKTIIVAGEACPLSLLSRHDRNLPHAALYNEYGPTEGSVWSTVYRVHAENESSTIPIGTPIANVQVYLLDEARNPVPIGVTGELYIGGAGVARGYLHVPARTAERFVPNLFGEPGTRLYRTGDLARYRPDGNIEYLGRIDHQVKIRGFRIELGEIEAALARHTQVKQAVVIAREDTSGYKRLVAYVVGCEPRPNAEALRAHLKEGLPEYMVPSAFVVLDALPLTTNGKLDRTALPEPDIEAQLAHQYVAPRHPTEEILAGIWAEVLGVKRVGINDNFFELGGDSILSIQIVSRARQMGLAFTPRDLFQHQTLATLTTVIVSDAATASEQEAVVGEVPLTPIQHWFFSQALPNAEHWNQAVMLEVRRPLNPDALKKAVEELQRHHDALRLRFAEEGECWRQLSMAEATPGVLQWVDLSMVSVEAQHEAMTAETSRWQASLNLGDGPIWRVIGFDLGEHRPSRLLIIIHHLAVDGVSWRILLEDLQRAYRQACEGERIELPAKTTSFKQWAERLQDHVARGVLDPELSYWVEAADAQSASLPVDDPSGANLEGQSESVTESLDMADTEALLHAVPAAYHTQINDVLLTPLVQTLGEWTQTDSILIDLEGHGREEFDGADLSRTVGWFTSVFPVSISLPRAASQGDAIKAVKEQLRGIPNKGIGYGLLRYLSAPEITERMRGQPTPEIGFNYLGQFERVVPEGTLFPMAEEPTGPMRGADNLRCHELDIDAYVSGGRLQLTCTYSGARYRRATIEDLAHRYLTALRALIQHCLSAEAGGYTPSDFPLARLSQTELDAMLRRRADIEDIYPLAPLQQGLIFHSLYAPESGVYCNQFTCVLDGQLEPEAFVQAWRLLVGRHPVLRTAFMFQGRDVPLQIIYRDVQLPIDRLDWRGFPATEQELRWKKYLARDRCRGFEFQQPPMMRLALVKCSPGRHYFLWSHHHAILDGWCTSLVFKQVFAAYQTIRNAEEPNLIASRPYRDYIAWLQLQCPSVAETYWREVLRGFSTPTPLGIDRPALRRSSENEYGEFSSVLSEADTRHLRDFVKVRRLTLYTLVQGVWALLLSRYTGERDVLFGVTVSGRPSELAGVDQMVGLFINTVPLRVQLSFELRVVDWLLALLQQNIELRLHEHVPLVEIQSWSEVQRGQPLFESLLSFENYPMDWTIEDQAASLGVREPVFDEQESYPLVVTATPIPSGDIAFRFDYQRDRFNDSAIATLAKHFQCLLEGLVANPEAQLSELPMLTDPERRQMLVEWNATEAEFPRDKCLNELFEAQVGRTPDAVAVVYENQQLAYGELNARANQLAHYLRAQGMGPDRLVGVCVERSLEMVIGILGILKAGGAYLPIDRSYPEERIAFTVKDVGLSLVLTHSATRSTIDGVISEGMGVLDLEGDWELIGRCGSENPVCLPTAEHLAYVIYTSGSTGKPKGVAVTHGNIVASTWARLNYYQEPIGRFLLLSSFVFDSSVAGIFWTLCQGACLRLPSEDAHRDPGRLAEVIGREAVTHLLCLPSLYRLILEHGAGYLDALRTVIVAGEACAADLVGLHHQALPQASLFNEYGPTEGTVWSSAYQLQPEDAQASVSIGRPIANAQIYLLDSYLNPTPVGVAGELYIGGAGLARCYLNRPDATAERFMSNPFGDRPGERLYRTGDLARYRPDGNIEYLGRIDHQVKIRGFRIELGEVGATLARHPQVKEAVVIAREDTGDKRRLVAYVVGHEPQPTVEVLRTHLKAGLPEYMVPAAFVFLDALPLTSNGKLDRKALPAPNTVRAAPDGGASEPRNPIEHALEQIWCEVLNISPIGIHDNFFDHGGHSLSAIQVLARVQERFQVELSVASLFEAPTIAKLAALVTEQCESHVSHGLESMLDEIEELSEEEARVLVRGQAPLGYAHE